MENNFMASEQAYEEMLGEPDAYIEHHKGGDNLSWDLPRYSSTPLYAADKIATIKAELESRRSDAESWRAYKKRKDEVIAAGMGRKILRDAAAPKEK